MEAIVKRGNSYSVVYMTTIEGQQRQKWETYHTQKEANERKRFLDLCAEESRKRPTHDVQTMGNLMERYIALYGSVKWSPSTVQSNLGLIRNYILPLWGSIRPISVSKSKFISRKRLRINKSGRGRKAKAKPKTLINQGFRLCLLAFPR